MDDLKIKNILGVDIKCLCNDGEIHTVSFLNIKNCGDSTMSIKSDDNKMVQVPREIDIHIKCKGYDVGIDMKDNG